MTESGTPRLLVLGQGGLVGSAVVRASQRRGVAVTGARDVPWECPADSAALLSGVAGDFLAEVEDARWGIVWAAGRATPSSPPAVCDKETDTIRQFAAQLAAKAWPAAGGTLVMVSSAGGAYSGTESPRVSEDSPEAPTTSYGAAKLEQEQVLADLCASLGMRFVAARLTNIYGPGQDSSKAQGLVTKVCESTITGRPVVLTASLDAQRDFVYVDDSASAILDLLFGTRCAEVSGPVIVASSQPLSLGSVLGTVRRLSATRRPLVLTRPDPQTLADGHFVYASHKLAPDTFATTNFTVGVAQTFYSLIGQAQATGASGRTTEHP